MVLSCFKGGSVEFGVLMWAVQQRIYFGFWLRSPRVMNRRCKIYKASTSAEGVRETSSVCKSKKMEVLQERWRVCGRFRPETWLAVEQKLLRSACFFFNTWIVLKFLYDTCFPCVHVFVNFICTPTSISFNEKLSWQKKKKILILISLSISVV